MGNGRLLNPDPAHQEISCDGDTITWRRSGFTPEVWDVRFAYATSGFSLHLGGAGRSSRSRRRVGAAFHRLKVSGLEIDFVASGSREAGVIRLLSLVIGGGGENNGGMQSRDRWGFTSFWRRWLTALLGAGTLGTAGVVTAASAPLVVVSNRTARLEAEAAAFGAGRIAVVEQGGFSGGRGVTLRPAAAARVDAPEAAPDLRFRVRAAAPGRFVIRTHAATDAEGRALMRRAQRKQDSLFLRIAVGTGRPTRRVVFVPWSRPESCRQTLGKFALDGSEQTVRVWLPKGVILDALELFPYRPPRVPEAAKRYRPSLVPPPSRPRLWVNRESLPEIRARLTRGENAPLWAKVRRQAAKPFPFAPEPGREIGYNAALERAAVARAFVHLMTGEEAPGREAVALMRDYLEAVEFGNLLDITREIGRAIYSGALVYDWCHELLTPAERASLRRNFLRLAGDMEVGWPPFRQMIVMGHGNEAQINRDLLSLAIAVYDEDPLPYRYCAYRVLEELVPMRRFEYQSPRHNQGVAYGPYRFGWDLHAAWLLRRMSGRRVFDDNLAGVYAAWIHLRLPNGETFRDGDGFSDGRPVNFGLTPLLAYAYAADPVIKYDFLQQGGLARYPIPALLLNDPDLKPAPGFAGLPLAFDFGPILGGMVCRTGWRMGPDSPDVAVTMFGGGYQFGNHHHADPGSFQIYYRGLQVADLGQYLFYGTPYDYNFCKRSVAHSMMLVLDPDEKFPPGTVNDGGARFVRSTPRTPGEARTKALFANGRVLSAAFGPSRRTPTFGCFAVDLASAYSGKITNYVRAFCFLNLENPRVPAALIVLDRLETARPGFKKYWQINTIQPPRPTPEGVTLWNESGGRTGRVHVNLLLPPPADRTRQILSGREANSVDGHYFAPPKPDRPEAHGHRIRFSPKRARTDDTFLAVFTMCDGDTPPPPVTLETRPRVYVVSLAGRTVALSRDGRPLTGPLTVTLRGAGADARPLLLTGLAAGRWRIARRDGGGARSVSVAAGQNTARLTLPPGDYTIRRLPGGEAKTTVRPANRETHSRHENRLRTGHGASQPGRAVEETDRRAKGPAGRD